MSAPDLMEALRRSVTLAVLAKGMEVEAHNGRVYRILHVYADRPMVEVKAKNGRRLDMDTGLIKRVVYAPSPNEGTA